MKVAAFRRRLVAAHRHARDRAACFVGIDQHRDRNGVVASGVYVRAHGRLFVATAAHNIDNGKRDPTVAMLLLTHHRPLDSCFTIVGGVTKGGKGSADEKWDLAVVELPPVALERTSRRAIAPEDIDASWTPKKNSWVFIYGLSEDLVRPHEDGGADFGEHGYATVPLLDEALPGATRRPEIDLFLQYPKTGTTYGRGKTMVRPWSPTGMSGGGVWTMGAKATQMRLVGLVVASHPAKDWVRAVRIGHWLHLLRAFLERAGAA